MFGRIVKVAEQSGLTKAEQELWRSFYSMRRSLDRAVDLQLQRDSNISASEYEVLMAIEQSADQRLRINEIAMRTSWEKSRVSHLVTRMEKRGLLLRSECPTDARGSWIGLSAAGQRAVSGALRGHVEAIRRYFFDVLGSGDAAMLDSLSERVIDAIGWVTDEDEPGEDPTVL
ncbi:MarR family transcriptional regulator [soil metagenome]